VARVSALEVIVVADAEALASVAADRIVSAIAGSARPFRLALAGGSTPKRLYAKLAKDERVDWKRVELFWGDERVVPPDHEKSNYRMVREALLDHISIPTAQVHRIEVEQGGVDAASDYFTLVDDRPLDLVLLGMGDDGHTASIFPDSEDATGVYVTRSPVPPTERVTLALDVINRAEEALLLVSGVNKSERLAEVYEQWHGRQAAVLPAARVRPGRLSWLVDEGAATELPELKGGGE
jgi:6-phosphogluconolactonase